MSYFNADQRDWSAYQVRLMKQLHEIDNGDFDVTTWEAEFIDSCFKQKSWLTDKQIGVVREMVDKYL